MISSICWVPKGAAAEKPVEFDGADEEPEADDASPGPSPAEGGRKGAPSGAAAAGDDAVLAEFQLDRYDEEEDAHDAGALPMFGRRMMMYHASNDQDPYITLRDGAEEEEDAEDLEISRTDLVLLGARSEEDVSNIEVHVLEEDSQNMYPHHDIILPSFPLAIEWLGSRPACAPAGPGANLVAVATFEPHVEIWDLDVLNTITPAAVLGGAGTEASAQQGAGDGAKGKKRRKAEPRSQGHTDSVMGLAWNRLQGTVLATASADKTVRLWDLASPDGACVRALEHHGDKVQAVRWHPSEASVLVTGAFDRTGAVLDVRAEGAQQTLRLRADVECAAWFGESLVLMSTEDGHVTCYDVRTGKDVWTLSAHTSAVAGLSVNPEAAHVFATCSPDKAVKLWSAKEGSPALLASKDDLGLGKLFDVSFCRDAPHLLGIGGSTGQVAVWNTLDCAPMSEALGMRRNVTPAGGSVIVSGMQAIDLNSSSDESDEEG